jgi:hypothetical protein
LPPVDCIVERRLTEPVTQGDGWTRWVMAAAAGVLLRSGQRTASSPQPGAAHGALP